MLGKENYILILGCFPKFKNRFKYNLKFAVMLAGFDYTRKFRWASNEVLLKCWNGIGAYGKWYNRFIPKSVWFLNVELPSLPHDFDYWKGGDDAKRLQADKRLLKNLLMWVRLNTKNKTLLRLREIGCYKYYLAVRAGGESAFNYNVY